MWAEELEWHARDLNKTLSLSKARRCDVGALGVVKAALIAA